MMPKKKKRRRKGCPLFVSCGGIDIEDSVVEFDQCADETSARGKTQTYNVDVHPPEQAPAPAPAPASVPVSISRDKDPYYNNRATHLSSQSTAASDYGNHHKNYQGEDHIDLFFPSTSRDTDFYLNNRNNRLQKASESDDENQEKDFKRKDHLISSTVCINREDQPGREDVIRGNHATDKKRSHLMKNLQIEAPYDDDADNANSGESDEDEEGQNDGKKKEVKEERNEDGYGNATLDDSTAVLMVVGYSKDDESAVNQRPSQDHYTINSESFHDFSKLTKVDKLDSISTDVFTNDVDEGCGDDETDAVADVVGDSDDDTIDTSDDYTSDDDNEDDTNIKPNLVHTVNSDTIGLPTVPNCPAPPSAPMKKSYTRRASRPRLAPVHLEASNTEDILKSPLAAADSKPEDILQQPGTGNHPAPPTGVPRRSSINRASKPRLPRDHFTFISKTEELQVPSVHESDGIDQAKRRSPSSELLRVFQDVPDENTDVESTFSLNSTESELLKLIDFKTLNDSRDEVPSERGFSPVSRPDNCPHRNGFEITPSTRLDILGSHKALDNPDIPKTNHLHPLGAASMVLGPIGLSRGTPEQIPRSQTLMSKQNTPISSLVKYELPTARRLEFHSSVPPRGPSVIPPLETTVMSQNNKMMRDIQPKARIPSNNYRTPPHFSKKRVTFDPQLNLQSSTALQNILPKSQNVEDLQQPNCRKEASIDTTLQDAFIALTSTSNERHLLESARVLPNPWYLANIEQPQAFAKNTNGTYWGQPEDIAGPSRRPAWQDPLASSSIERHLLDSGPARHSWISNSDMRQPPTSLSDQLTANNRKEELDSGRLAGASTSSLPSPLPPPDLLAPTLFQRRAGTGLPPVMGRALPPPPPSHLGIRPGHSRRGGQAAQDNYSRVTGRTRTNKY